MGCCIGTHDSSEMSSVSAENEDMTFEILLLGADNSGKSTIMKHFLNGQFSEYEREKYGKVIRSNVLANAQKIGLQIRDEMNDLFLGYISEKSLEIVL